MNLSLLAPLFLFIEIAAAATFTIQNNCNFTIWPADIPTAGGTVLNPGQTWTYSVPPGTSGRVWGRVGCSRDGSRCQTGDCNGDLYCRLSGNPPTTMAEYTLNGFSNFDYIDLSVTDGFNLPMEFSANSAGCNLIRRCTADIISQCPKELQVPGGCINRGGYGDFFKQRCPDAGSIVTCPAGGDYQVIFCP